MGVSYIFQRDGRAISKVALNLRRALLNWRGTGQSLGSHAGNSMDRGGINFPILATPFCRLTRWTGRQGATSWTAASIWIF